MRDFSCNTRLQRNEAEALLHGLNEQRADPELDLLEVGAATDLVLAHLDLPKAHLIQQSFQGGGVVLPAVLGGAGPALADSFVDATQEAVRIRRVVRGDLAIEVRYREAEDPTVHQDAMHLVEASLGHVTVQMLEHMTA